MTAAGGLQADLRTTHEMHVLALSSKQRTWGKTEGLMRPSINCHIHLFHGVSVADLLAPQVISSGAVAGSISARCGSVRESLGQHQPCWNAGTQYA